MSPPNDWQLPPHEFAQYKNERGEYKQWLHLYEVRNDPNDHVMHVFQAPWVFDFEPEFEMLQAIYKLTTFADYPIAWHAWYRSIMHHRGAWHHRTPLYWVLWHDVGADAMRRAIGSNPHKLFYDPNRSKGDAET